MVWTNIFQRSKGWLNDETMMNGWQMFTVDDIIIIYEDIYIYTVDLVII